MRLQHYRLVPWQTSGSINYRRFFDICDLVGVRPGSATAFPFLHAGLLRLARTGAITGVRVDHIDGLSDPGAYLRRLRSALARASGDHGTPFLVVEKILALDETLPDGWPVDGTTGYEALNRITEVLVPAGADGPLEEAYRTSVPVRRGAFRDLAYESKGEVVDRLFPGERDALLERLVPGSSPRDGAAMADAMRAVTAALGVYRTYVVRGRGDPASLRRIRTAVGEAARREPSLADSGALRAFERRALRDKGQGGFLARWQQWTGAVAAKGIEDTAFYRHSRFLASNEVGWDPDRIGLSIGEFHRFEQERAARWPGALTPTSTHDSKWGEDTRARLVALAEWAGAWHASTDRWHRTNRRFASERGAHRAPTPEEEYRLYQTLAATAPTGTRFPSSYRRRLSEHLVKVAREAKLESSWLSPDRDHEASLGRFARSLLEDPLAERFREELAEWTRRLSFFGAYYSLVQALLRSTTPGVPDVYQGSEGWNLSLVDPDNRRPAPFARLERLLDRALSPAGRPAAASPPAEIDKIALTARTLRFRRDHRALFDRGSYVPVEERGLPVGVPPVLAFLRRRADEWLLVAVGRGLVSVNRGRLVPPVGERWRGRSLPLPPSAPRRWERVLTGGEVRFTVTRSGSSLPLDGLFDRQPFALLYHAPSRPGTSAPRRPT